MRFYGMPAATQTETRKEIDAFKAKSNITIEPDFIDWGASFQKITTDMAGGTVPDVFATGGIWVPVLASKGITRPLDDFLKAWPDWTDFYPSMKEDASWKGEVHGIPYEVTYRGNPVWRKSYFKNAGLDPEKAPKTWEEAKELGKRLTKREGDKWEIAGFNLQIDSTQVYEDFLVQAGGHYFNEDRTKPTNNTPEGKQALEMLVWFGVVGQTMPKEGMQSGAPDLIAVAAGKVAIEQMWAYHVAAVERTKPEVFKDIGIGEPLTGPKAKALQIYVNRHAISSKSKEPEAAWEAIKYSSESDRNYRLNIVPQRSMPVRKALESFEMYQTSPWKELAANAQWGKPREVVPQHFDVQPAMGRWVEKAARGTISVEEALKGMDDEVAEILARK